MEIEMENEIGIWAEIEVVRGLGEFERMKDGNKKDVIRKSFVLFKKDY